MARMLQALKNLEAKEARQQTNCAAAAPKAEAGATKSAAVATNSANSSSSSSIAPRIIEAVDKLDAVVGNELSGIASPMSSLAFAPAPDFAFTDFPFLGQPQAGGSPVPSSPVPVLASMPQIEPEAKKLPASISATRAPCELERRLKRVLSEPARS